jgi:hypothetical protein
LSVDVVLGVSAFLVWHLLLVQPLVWAAPARLQARIPDHLRGPLQPQLLTLVGWLRVCAGLAVGAVTHVAWDAFTHTGMWGARALPWLATPVQGLTLTRWLHLASSVAGLAVLGLFLTRWWRTAPIVGSIDPIRPGLRWALAGVVLGLAGVATITVAAALVSAPGRVSRQVLLIDSLVEFVSKLGLGLVVGAVAWHVVGAVRRERERAGSR